MRLPGRMALLLLAFAALRAEARMTVYTRTYRSPADGEYRVYDIGVPSSYDPSRPSPAILFLHGRGAGKSSFEIASYTDPAEAAGIVEIFWQGRFQSDIGAFSTLYVDGKNGVPDETDVLACLDDALSAYAIDPDRVHLAGFSQGGKGALLIGLKHPDRFASVAEGAGPSDAFQGQLWSPTFPDFAAAAGGPAATAAGETLALWYAQSARFLLANARNLPLALFHGTADPVVPDSPLLFPYRNTHHIADTPGFSDARGATATLSELHAADPDGYPFQVTYVAGAGHEWAAFPAPALFAFFAGKARVLHPPRVVARTYEARPARFYWLEMTRATPPDGEPIAATADASAQAIRISAAGEQRLALDPAGAGIDPARPYTVSLDGGAHVALRLRGAWRAGVRVSRGGLVLGAPELAHDGSDLLLDAPAGSPVAFSVAPPPSGAIDESDLLVPAFVDAPGLLGARFRTELVVANLGEADASVEALLASRPGAPFTLPVPRGATVRLDSAAILSASGLTQIASPLRLRVVSGDPSRLFASARVFNDAAGAGTFGASFPVRSAADSVLGPGAVADLFGGAPAHPSRANLSLFAPFEAANASVTVYDASGTAVRKVDVALAPLERAQLDGVLEGVAAPARIAVGVSSGRVQAYATVIDQSSRNDPFVSVPLPRALASSRWTVPAVASAVGRLGARFSSDLFLHAEAAATVAIRFLPRGGGEPRAASVALAAGSTAVLEDLVAALFPGASAGALALDADLPLQAFAVTRADSDAGPASQDLACVRAGDEIAPEAPAVFTGIAESAVARSNLVLVNGPVPNEVELALHAADGPRGTLAVTLAADEVRQLDSVSALFGGGPVEAGALVVAPRSGPLVASAVRIDNRSNDPAGLAPLRAAALAIAR